jgi:hypothetical protein
VEDGGGLMPARQNFPFFYFLFLSRLEYMNVLKNCGRDAIRLQH